MLQGKTVMTDTTGFAKGCKGMSNLCFAKSCHTFWSCSDLVLCSLVFLLGIKYLTALHNECILISFDCIGSKRFAEFLASRYQA